VIKSFQNGYLILFNDAERALRCSRHLQRAVSKYNMEAADGSSVQLPLQRIALDFGFISRIIRAYGFDYTGEPLVRCALLINKTEYGKIYMTSDFFMAAKDRFSEGYIEQRIIPLNTESINDARLLGCQGFLWLEFQT
jgi:hypothetical protein